jgi:hypothetical protein
LQTQRQSCNPPVADGADASLLVVGAGADAAPKLNPPVVDDADAPPKLNAPAAGGATVVALSDDSPPPNANPVVVDDGPDLFPPPPSPPPPPPKVPAIDGADGAAAAGAAPKLNPPGAGAVFVDPNPPVVAGVAPPNENAEVGAALQCSTKGVLYRSLWER